MRESWGFISISASLPFSPHLPRRQLQRLLSAFLFHVSGLQVTVCGCVIKYGALSKYHIRSACLLNVSPGRWWEEKLYPHPLASPKLVFACILCCKKYESTPVSHGKVCWESEKRRSGGGVSAQRSWLPASLSLDDFIYSRKLQNKHSYLTRSLLSQLSTLSSCGRAAGADCGLCRRCLWLHHMCNCRAKNTLGLKYVASLYFNGSRAGSSAQEQRRAIFKRKHLEKPHDQGELSNLRKTGCQISLVWNTSCRV